jgi:TonB family protein
MKTFFTLLGIISLVAPVLASDQGEAPPPAKHFKIIQTARMMYPLRMMNEGVSHGVSKAVLHVNAQGQLVDFLVVAYTHLAFAEETEQAIKKWRFEPEYADGEPIDTVMEITFNFEVNGVMLVQRFGNYVPHLDAFAGYEYQACSMRNLDRIPTPVSIVTPTYPLEWGKRGISGKVVVDFYIDETGKTRFVASPVGSNELLAGIAVAAVQKWQFSPPTRKGRPVLVHAQQIFDFLKEDAKSN